MRTQTLTKRVYLLDPNEVDNLALDGTRDTGRVSCINHANHGMGRPAYYSGAYTGTYQYRRKKYMSLDLYIKFTTKDWQSGRR